MRSEKTYCRRSSVRQYYITRSAVTLEARSETFHSAGFGGYGDEPDSLQKRRKHLHLSMFWYTLWWLLGRFPLLVESIACSPDRQGGGQGRLVRPEHGNVNIVVDGHNSPLSFELRHSERDHQWSIPSFFRPSIPSHKGMSTCWAVAMAKYRYYNWEGSSKGPQ